MNGHHRLRYLPWFASLLIALPGIAAGAVPGRAAGGRPAPQDLSVSLGRCPAVVHPGQSLGSTLAVTAKSTCRTALCAIAVDLVLASSAIWPVPAPYFRYRPKYSSGVLLRGGRELVSWDRPGSIAVRLTGANVIPADTPPGYYYLGAVVDAGNKVSEANELNNIALRKIRVTGGPGRSRPKGAKP